MDKHRSQLCSTTYKKTLDDAYKQLALLEFQGYAVWMHALQLLQLDTFFVVLRYNKTVTKHKDFFDSNTCQIAISNSVNVKNCTNGNYVYSGMDEDVLCEDNYYLTSKSISLYVNKVARVSSEMSPTTYTLSITFRKIEKMLSLFSDRSSAREIIGLPNVYPTYGNNTQAWSPAPDDINNPQFIVVRFKDPLFVEEINIYETYHGGAVWKIEGLNGDGKWKVLMEKSKQSLQDIEKANIYNATINIDWSTSQLKVSIDCTKSGKAVQIDAIRMTGRPVKGTCSWYDSLSCTPCGCDSTGSYSTTCSSDGQCRCKTGYKGKRCLSRDCVIGQWSAWSNCECGPGKTKERTRKITQSRYGAGKACEKTKETVDCNLVCQCGVGERGDYCEHKDCLMSNWGSWSDCPPQESKVFCNGKDKEYHLQFRYRSIIRNKQNNGAACPSNKQQKRCPKPKCKELRAYEYGRDS
ncbi:hypothetical protein FSP39_013995 [Pinctada imbricata]|uniref:Pappalysin-1 SD scarf domain-containing protein n=1 Tax=Pinctada imbricata TaxID=66713 RepID=A0AA89C916_PINIB|nr:hypothetical protein FSP39_013995 [Pinctada imbricata]